MAKRFKLRISKVITSFNTCRSDEPSNLPQDPVPSKSSSSFRRHVSSVFISIGSRFTSKAGAPKQISTDSTGSEQFKWQKEERFHAVVAKIYDETNRRKTQNSSGFEDEILATPPRSPPHAAEKKTRRAKKKKIASKLRISTSSLDSGWFSSEERIKEEEETETLVSSSRSFSTDDSSSEFNPHLRTISEAQPTSRRKKKTAKRSVSRCGKKNKQRTAAAAVNCSSPEIESPARLSVFKKLIPCSVEGKVKESFAIVKRSEEPYEDFKKSMMEMILEKEMFEKEDLEQLLQCFLSLNSKDYHGMIVEAFTEIWGDLFSSSSTS